MIVFDDDLPTGALTFHLHEGVVVSISDGQPKPGARPATEKERQSFWDHFWGKGDFLYPFDFSGLSPFQADAVRFLRTVAPGEMITYGELAFALGHPRAARAVGSAMGKNPFPILFACHRVIPKSGGVGHYGLGGTAKKKALLDWEAQLVGDLRRL